MNVILQREEKEEEDKLSSNKKVLYQLWTDGNGNFGVKNDDDEEFEYLDSPLKQESCLKFVDDKFCYDDNCSLTDKFVQDWIEELKQEGTFIEVKT